MRVLKASQHTCAKIKAHKKHIIIVTNKQVCLAVKSCLQPYLMPQNNQDPENDASEPGQSSVSTTVSR